MAKTSGLIRTIKDVHFNDMFPQNRNVKVKSKKQNLAERFVRGEWKVEPMQTTVNEMILNGMHLLQSVWRPGSDFFTRVCADDALTKWMANMIDVERNSRKGCIVRARQEVRALLLSSKL